MKKHSGMNEKRGISRHWGYPSWGKLGIERTFYPTALTLARRLPRTSKKTPLRAATRTMSMSNTWGAPRGSRGTQPGRSPDPFQSTKAIGGVPYGANRITPVELTPRS